LGFSTNSGSAWTVQTYGTTPTSDGGFKTYVNTGASGYVAAGDLISSLKDSNPGTGTTTWTALNFTDAVPANTQIQFQLAASNTSTGPFSFVGPDGSATSFFSTSGASLAQFNGKRYLKYRAFLSTGTAASTPTLNDASVCYSISTPPPSADLAISNTDNVSSVVAGGSVTYAIVATNNGPNSVTGATVTDSFPAALTCNWTCAGANGGSCTASGSGNISDSKVNLTSGATATYTATCAVSTSATGSLSNTASIASSVSDPTPANNSVTDTDTITVSTTVAITVTDNLNLVKIGQVIDYVIEVTNGAGPSNASATVTDALPAQLSGGTWTCVASNGATCGSPSGSGNTLSDSASLPQGSKVDYTYTATVMSSNSNGQISNLVSAKMNSGGNQAQANLTATDSDTVVIFDSSFESASKPLSLGVTGGNGGSSVTAQLGVDAGLLNTVTVAPVTIATGRAADGRTLFSIQLMRMGAKVAMRTLTTIDDTQFSDVSAWKVIELKQNIIALAWQSASSRGDDGYLRIGSLPLSSNNSRDGLTHLQVATQNDIPWLVPVEP